MRNFAPKIVLNMNRIYLPILLVLYGVLAAPAALMAQQQDTLPQLSSPTDTLEEFSTEVFSLATPRRTVSSHLRFLQEDKFDPQMAARTLYRGKRSEEEMRELAIQLKQIYDGEAYYVYVEEIPDDPNYKDSLGHHRYRVFPKYPDIYVEKIGDQWLYSKKTVNIIGQIHDQLFPVGTDFLVKLTPKIGQKKALGLKVWQWEGMVLLLLLGFLVYRLFDWVWSFVIKRLVPRVFRSSLELNMELIHAVARPFSMLLVTLLIQWLFPVLQLPIGLGRYVALGLKIATSVFGVVVLYRIVDLLSSVMEHLASRTETALDDQLIPLVRKVAKLIVVSLGVIFVLQNLDVNVTALLAGVSIGGLALALAAQDTVKNFIGSITVFVDQPFQIGDFIETPKGTGTVMEVGVRSTRLRTLDGSVLSIPNGDLVNQSVTNHGLRAFRRYVTNIGVTYDTPPAKLQEFVEKIQQIVQQHPDTRKEGNIIYFHEMADSSLNINFTVYFELTDYAGFLKARQEILLEIMYLAEKMDISFAFPSTSVYIEQLPEKYYTKE